MWYHNKIIKEERMKPNKDKMNGNGKVYPREKYRETLQKT